MSVALLNPPLEAAVCREMIAHARSRMAVTENRLLGTVLERDLYLKTIAAHMELRALIEDLEQVYRTHFNV